MKKTLTAIIFAALAFLFAGCSRSVKESIGSANDAYVPSEAAITLNGSMEVKEVKVDPSFKNVSEAELGEEIKAAFNKGIRDSQMMAAQAMGSNFGIPNA